MGGESLKGESDSSRDDINRLIEGVTGFLGEEKERKISSSFGGHGADGSRDPFAKKGGQLVLCGLLAFGVEIPGDQLKELVLSGLLIGFQGVLSLLEFVPFGHGIHLFSQCRWGLGSEWTGV